MEKHGVLRRLAFSAAALGLMLAALAGSPPAVVADPGDECGTFCETLQDCNSGCGCPRGGMGICVPNAVD